MRCRGFNLAINLLILLIIKYTYRISTDKNTVIFLLLPPNIHLQVTAGLHLFGEGDYLGYKLYHHNNLHLTSANLTHFRALPIFD